MGSFGNSEKGNMAWAVSVIVKRETLQFEKGFNLKIPASIAS